MSELLIFGLAALGFTLTVFLVLAVWFPDVVRTFFENIKEIEVSIRGLRVRLAVREAEVAVMRKERQKPSRRKLRADLEAIPPSSRVLWVDDHPENNEHEIRALKALEVEIDTVTSNDEAEQAVSRDGYDLIISDIGRDEPEEATAGLQLPARLAAVLGYSPRVVYYTGHAEWPETPDGYPVADTPSHLLQLIRLALPRPA